MSAKIADAYTLKLTPFSPIHVGSGREYFPQEYCPVRDPDRVHIINLDQLIRQHPEVTEQLTARERVPLWATDAVRYVREPALVRNRDKVDRHTAQDIKDAAELGNAATIWEFAKDDLSRPFLPGSTMKGAVRTAIAYRLLMDSPLALTNVKNAIVKSTSRGQAAPGDKEAVERLVFKTEGDAHDDLMRLWSFRDSPPLDCDKSLTVVAGKRLSSMEPLGYLNQYEVLTDKSGTLDIDVSFDCALAESGHWKLETLASFPETIADVCTCLNRFADDIIEHELDYFRNHPVNPLDVVTFYEGLQERRRRGEVLLCLGKGTGWHKKTIGLLLHKDPSTAFRDVVAAYNLGRGQRRFTGFPTSREMVVRNGKPAVFGWAQIEVVHK
jgi:CRISPR-associated protein Csm5